MKAAILYQPNKPLEIEDVKISKPGPREVLIRTAAAGVCHSDLHFANGTYPYPLPAILGHESAGIVEQVGRDVTYVQPGDHVITCLSTFCGHCHHCTTGHLQRCFGDPTTGQETVRKPDEEQRLGTLSGEGPMHQFLNLSSFAEQMLVHEHSIAKIRPDMPLDKAALIGCGVLTGAGAAINTANVRPGETVVVIGCGGVGLSAVNGAAIAGAGRIIAIDMVPSKLELARKFGATDTVNPAEGDPVEQVLQMTSGGVDHSFEAIGLKVTVEQAFRMLARGGTCTSIGMIPPGTMIELHGVDFLGEKKIQGSLMGSSPFRVDMPRFVDFYLAGKLHLDEMVSAHIGLSDVNDALHNLEKGEVARQVIMFDQ